MRTKAAFVVFLALGALLAGCGHQWPVPATVTHKTIEGPRVDSVCNGSVNLICGENEIPTKYLVQVRWESQGETFWGTDPGEKWCEVDPHEYELARVGVELQYPGNCWDIDWESR